MGHYGVKFVLNPHYAKELRDEIEKKGNDENNTIVINQI